MILYKMGATEEDYDEEQQDLSKMPFGKYKGTPIDEVNPFYIGILLTKSDYVKGQLKTRLKKSFAKQVSELSPKFIRQTLSNDPVWLDSSIREKLEQAFEEKKKEKECFGYMENPQSKECMKCPFWEDCKEATQSTTYNYDSIEIDEDIENW